MVIIYIILFGALSFVLNISSARIYSLHTTTYSTRPYTRSTMLLYPHFGHRRGRPPNNKWLYAPHTTAKFCVDPYVSRRSWTDSVYCPLPPDSVGTHCRLYFRRTNHDPKTPTSCWIPELGMCPTDNSGAGPGFPSGTNLRGGAIPIHKSNTCPTTSPQHLVFFSLPLICTFPLRPQRRRRQHSQRGPEYNERSSPQYNKTSNFTATHSEHQLQSLYK